MLQELQIQNYAIIKHINIGFSPNLNIITGETGAGKSILVGALGLILGNRADASVLLDTEKKCVVEALFTNVGNDVIQFLKDGELDVLQELTIRREITGNGKSRAFVNDTPVSLQQLKSVSSLLVNLHKQFDTLEIAETNFQRNVVDVFADNLSLLTQYQQLFSQWQTANNQLTKLAAEKSSFQKDYDYNKFLFDELQEANFSENELENIEAELDVLNNAEAIKTALAAIAYQIKSGDEPIATIIKQLLQNIQQYSNHHANINALHQRLQSAYIELNDIADDAEKLSDEIMFDAEKIETYNNKLALGYKLLKKHGVQTTQQLLQIQQSLGDKLDFVLNIDEAILQQEALANSLLKQCTELAETLHKNRLKVSNEIANKVNSLLTKVGMPNAKISVGITKTSMHKYGIDDIQFLWDANKSGRFEPLGKIASGGELSRVMLSIKSLVGKKMQLPTMIFDEIDTGISGEAAKQVGNIMKELSGSIQIISITHQPQIAAKAHKHFFVFKQEIGGSINTQIKELESEERTLSIAGMIAGEAPTESTLNTVREMIAE